MKVIRMIVVSVGVIISVLGQSSTESVRASCSRDVLLPESIYFMTDARDADSLESAGRLLGRQPLYVQVSTGERLVTLLNEGSKLEWDDADPQSQRHDPRLIAGRAAWMLEMCFGFEVPPLSADATVREREHASLLASVQFRAFKEGIHRAREQSGLESLKVHSLRETYQLRIRAHAPPGGMDLHFDDREAFLEMLARWYPLGKRLEDLETIVGQKAERPTDPEGTVWVYHYDFFHPRSGMTMRFAVEDGRIVSVDLSQGEG